MFNIDCAHFVIVGHPLPFITIKPGRADMISMYLCNHFALFFGIKDFYLVILR